MIFLYICLKFLGIFTVVVTILVQFYVILVRDGMFYQKHISSNLDTIFTVLKIPCIYTHEKNVKILAHFGDATYQE